MVSRSVDIRWLLRGAGAVLLFALGGSVQPAGGQDAEPVVLRLTGEPGQRLEYVHEKRLTLQLPAELGGTISTRTALRLEQRVVSSGPDSIVVVSTLRDFAFDADPPPPQLPDLSRLDGVQFRSTATPSGRIYGIELDGAPEPLATSIRQQVEGWLRDLGFPALSVGPVRIGDRWTDTTRVPLAALLGLQGDAEALAVRTTTLTSIEPANDDRSATLAVTVTWTSPTGPGGRTVTIEGTSEQTVRFLSRRGLYRDSRGTSWFLVEIEGESGAPPLRIEASGRYETVLADPDG